MPQVARMLQAFLAGGAGEFCSNQQTTASSSSYLIDVTPGADHSLRMEQLAFPRIVSNSAASATCTSVWNKLGSACAMLAEPLYSWSFWHMRAVGLGASSKVSCQGHHG